MENPENVLMELNTYEKDPAGSLPKVLEEYLVFVAKTGNTVFPWPKIKPVVRTKLDLIITDFNTAMPEEQVPKMPNVDTFKFTEMKQRIFEQLDSYSGIPFTMQRLCELLTQPKRHYKRVDKFMRGLEKVMLVVSTVEPLALNGEEGTNGRQERLETDRKEREQDKSERQETGDSVTMESPSKRIRLSSAEEEEEEAGPCDSQDSLVASVTQEKETTPESEDVELDTITCGPVSCVEETEVENMDIDTECTSSEARLSISPSTEETIKEDESVCDSGTAAVTTSVASLPTPTIATETEAEAASEAQPEAKVVMKQEEEEQVKAEVAVTEECETVHCSSSDGEAEASPQPGPASVMSPTREVQGSDTEAVKEEKDAVAADCSSSDQAVEREPPSPTNSEAEPAKEVSESDDDKNVEVKQDETTDETPDTASVESSEETTVRNTKEEETEAEVNGAADSSDEVMVAAVEKEQIPQQSPVETEDELKGEDPSPDQSDTALVGGSESTDSA